jgi:hypothetical protein
VLRAGNTVAVKVALDDAAECIAVAGKLARSYSCGEGGGVGRECVGYISGVEMLVSLLLAGNAFVAFEVGAVGNAVA